MRLVAALALIVSPLAIVAALALHLGVTLPSRSPEARLYDACQPLIIDQLRAPTTAKMSPLSDAKFYYRPDGTVEIDGTVDSQNGFGAMLRSGYYCIGATLGDGTQTIIRSSVVPR